MEKFKYRKELANDLGITTRTLERKLKEAKLSLPKGLLSQQNQLIIKTALGFNE
jgi:transcriptional antiterminator